MAMPPAKRWQFLAIGAGVALLVGLGVAMALNGQKDGERMNAEPTGLVVNISDAPPVDSQKPLRCYVNGAFVGTVPLGECAEKNGVAAQALDVGLDTSGNLAAAPTASLAPPPEQTEVQPVEVPTAEPVARPDPAPQGARAACLRFASNEWSRLSDGMTLNQCVTALYDGRCESPGSASYGRWGAQTLRLVPKRVEVSDNNRDFRTLVEQGQGCTVR